MLNTYKSKIDHETQPNWQAKEIPEHYLLHCSIYEKEREVLFKTKKKKYKKTTTKNSQYILTLTMEDVLGEQNVIYDDRKSLREAFEKYINSTMKDV